MTVSRRQYEQNVFINCPFDAQYTPIFERLLRPDLQVVTDGEEGGTSCDDYRLTASA